jgi:hypothetical protein
MLRPTAAFRMKKYLKFMFYHEHDAHRRGELRRQVVQAQLASEVRVKDKKSRNQPDLEAS